MVSISKSLYPGTERISRGRAPSKNFKVASSQSIFCFDNEMHLPVKGTGGRCAYCSISGEQLHSALNVHLQISILCNR